MELTEVPEVQEARAVSGVPGAVAEVRAAFAVLEAEAGHPAEVLEVLVAEAGPLAEDPQAEAQEVKNFPHIH